MRSTVSVGNRAAFLKFHNRITGSTHSIDNVPKIASARVGSSKRCLTSSTPVPWWKWTVVCCCCIRLMKIAGWRHWHVMHTNSKNKRLRQLPVSGCRPTGNFFLRCSCKVSSPTLCETHIGAKGETRPKIWGQGPLWLPFGSATTQNAWRTVRRISLNWQNRVICDRCLSLPAIIPYNGNNSISSLRETIALTVKWPEWFYSSAGHIQHYTERRRRD